MTDSVNVAVLDVMFQGQPGAIAAGLLEGPAGIAVVDPGPASCLAGLEAALAGRGHALQDIHAILVTHIHLDHAGAVGVLARIAPEVQVFVHQRGAAHMAEPSRLIDSARRIYRDRMDRLWGEVIPVPASRIRSLAGGEQLTVVGRAIDVMYAPGHAWHHIVFRDQATGIVFTGDVGGMCVGRSRYIVPPTPPPDIDVELWEAAIDRIRAWQPRSLVVAHFGVVDQPGPHLDVLRARLREMAALVRQSLDWDGSDAERAALFKDLIMARVRSQLGDAAAEVERGVFIEECWHGLARYWRRQR